MAEAAAAKPTLSRALAWVGGELSDVDGDPVGSVYGFFVDAVDGEPAWLIARVGRRRRSARLVAVPLRDCAGGEAAAWVAHSGDALRAAPVVDPARPLRREHELAICEHFGEGPAVGRAAEVSGRPEGEVTARPLTA